MPADSVRILHDSFPAAILPVEWRDAVDNEGMRLADDADRIYGNAVLNTELSGSGTIRERPLGEPENALILNGVSVVIFLFFCYLVHSYRPLIQSVFKSTVVRSHFQSLMGEQSVSFRIFLSLSNLLGFLCLLAICLKMYLLRSEDMGFDAERVPGLYVFPALAIALAAIMLYRWMVHAALSNITMRGEVVSNIVFFNKIIFSVFSFILTPVVLIAAFSDPQNERVTVLSGSVILALMVLYYVFKSCGFFVERKISLLQWILYLCAVEIWPVSFFILLALRDY